ncbi:outer membrane beta-barrel protein [Rapidithrix thailandica]|uniref:Outer membrane beta-barrel protein n=1 Tax=Rapidithrix thailandica TaxID=413964 RepID=A0AAW9S7B6_9BACT
MQRKLLLITMSLLITTFSAHAQIFSDSSGFEFSGSADIYYKYDFSGNPNIPTSFANEQNSFSIGMLDLSLSKTINKVTLVGEVSFGPRAAQSLPSYSVDDETDLAFNLQNLYISYALTEKLSVTAGYMGTFLGYEVISPTGNFHYSTSYLFSYGPFQNAGIKLDYAFSDRVALMVGVFNQWNVFDNSVFESKDFGAQLYLVPVEGWDMYLNFVTGSINREFDLTTTYSLGDLTLGLNVASWENVDYEPDLETENSTQPNFFGGALYLSYAISDAVALGVRGEHFSTEKTGYLGAAKSVKAFTFSANLKSGPLTFIPEFRIDSGDKDLFLDSDEMATKSASQLLLAAIYAF